MSKTIQKTFQTSVRIFSTRWGHPDTYTIRFSKEGLDFDNGTGKSASCTFPKDGNPEWKGYGLGSSNPVINIFENDGIFVSDVIAMALESAWERWRDGDVTDDEIRSGLHELFAWVDQTARSIPSSEFWVGIF